MVADLDQHRDAFGVTRSGDGGRVRGGAEFQESSARNTEMTMPSGQSA
jgi:hypothetical protein